jgi:hypothetical protein
MSNLSATLATSPAAAVVGAGSTAPESAASAALPPGSHVAELAEMHDLHAETGAAVQLPGEVEEGNVEYSKATCV